MKVGVSAIERAFELARSGKFGSVQEIATALDREGYISGNLFGFALRKQLREMIKGSLGKAGARQ